MGLPRRNMTGNRVMECDSLIFFLYVNGHDKIDINGHEKPAKPVI